MSRSRKKYAILKQQNDKFFKRYSNKMIRHRDVQSGGQFKKILNPWSICDWKCDPWDERTYKKAVNK